MSAPNYTVELDTLIRARHPVIWVVTGEEERGLAMVQEIATHPDNPAAISKRVVLWSTSKGFSGAVTDAEAVDPIVALNAIMDAIKTPDHPATLWVLRDLHRYVEGPAYRFLRDAANALKLSQDTLIVTSPVAKLPVELEKDIVLTDLPLPGKMALEARLREETTVMQEAGKIPPLSNGTLEAVIRAGMGLTEEEFGAAVRESMVRHHEVRPSAIVKTKEQIIRKSGILELHQSVEGMEGVGGLDNAKAWVSQRVQSYTEKARAYNLQSPKGLLLTGVPGTGKTLLAKAAAQELGMPLLWLHSDAVQSKFVGESEQNLRRALRTVDAVSPAILFIDEVEKFLAGSRGGEGDNGVKRGMLGLLLTWMQEHTSPVLVIATCNEPDGLPPEFLGRFDGVFFAGLPNREERAAILRIHLGKRARLQDLLDGEVLQAAEFLQGYSGREIERVVNEAMYSAFASPNKTLTLNMLRSAQELVRPLSVVRKAQIDAMQVWAANYALPASRPSQTMKRIGVEL